MNSLAIRALRKARQLLVAASSSLADEPSNLPIQYSGQAASNLIRQMLLSSDPCMVARFGHNELNTALRRFGQRNGSFWSNAWGYTRGKQGPFWWDEEIRQPMRTGAGFFPCTDQALAHFGDRFLEDAGEIDMLGSWLPGERELVKYFPRAKTVPLPDLEPYFHRDPWTTALEGRTVLVIHPFETSIRRQYEKRALLYPDRRVLPDVTLKTLKSVQSIGGNGGGFNTWFEALDWMCERVREIEFDVAIIGAGAYGLPLAAFVKRIGRKAVHLGGATQILFGIRGKRWDGRPNFQELFNEHWTRPLPEETPASYYLEVEGGCYW